MWVTNKAICYQMCQKPNLLVPHSFSNVSAVYKNQISNVNLVKDSLGNVFLISKAATVRENSGS